MGLSQSLYTGWTGLSTHQRSMDNLSNNLANVNTTGYKKSDFQFSNLFKQALNVGGLSADGDRTSVNPKNIGMGVMTGAIVGNFTQGPIEQTNNPLECAIEGNGFFMVNTPRGAALTRDGSFWTDQPGADGLRMLCMGGSGYPVQGWNAVNGAITPSDVVETIRIPAIGDIMPGKRTENVSLTGVLPTNTSTTDFNGSPTNNLDLMGNLPGAGGIETTITVQMSQTDGETSAFRDEFREVKVRIDFTGPVQNGETSDWTWTMTTVDWPNAGDPGVRIYPPAGDSAFTQGTMSFHNQDNAETGAGAGQPVAGEIAPGGTRVTTDIEDENGNTITTSFDIDSDFAIDISHMTNMDNPPVDKGLGVWYADGNPVGTMRRTINVIDEQVAFRTVENNGVATVEAFRTMETRQNSIIFTREELTDESTTWSWRSSMDGGSGELTFNTNGELTNSTQSAGGLNYNFSDMICANQSGIVQVSSQDGYRDGVLQSVSVDQNGKIWGRYSNLVTEQLAQLAVATVTNPSGLQGASGNLFYANPAVAGAVLVGTANGDNGAGTIHSSSLEGSNVQLAQEFTNMISIERGYQFNSRIVTTSDEMLQTALQLKR